MSSRTSLLRMIILITFIIFILIIFLIEHPSNYYPPEKPDYNQIFYWQKENQAYSLLLHTISLQDSSFTAYSKVRDSLMIFDVNTAELDLINKMTNPSYFSRDCLNCHVYNNR